MGQYHRLVNMDRREFLDCHALGDGLKLAEQVSSGPGGVASALLVLLAASNGRGGGDLPDDMATEENRVVGRWAGQRIAMVGDYAEDDDFPTREGDAKPSAICELCATPDPGEEPPAGAFTNITPLVRRYMERLDWAYPDAEGWVRRIDLWKDITGIEYTHGNNPSRRTVVGRVGGAILEFWQDDVLAAVKRLPRTATLPISLSNLAGEFGLEPIAKEDR